MEGNGHEPYLVKMYCGTCDKIKPHMCRIRRVVNIKGVDNVHIIKCCAVCFNRMLNITKDNLKATEACVQEDILEVTMWNALLHSSR